MRTNFGVLKLWYIKLGKPEEMDGSLPIPGTFKGDVTYLFRCFLAVAAWHFGAFIP